MVSKNSGEESVVPTKKLREPSEEDKSLFRAYCEEANKRQRSSSENFDKAILTYSSGGLALSLAFLKDFIPISTASMPFLLFSSWALFVLSTALTTVSFLVSYKAQTLSIHYAEKYYLEGNADYLNRKSWCDRYTRWFNLLSGIAFILALVFTSIFVAVNLNKADEMAEKKVFTQDGLPSALMQKMSTGSTGSSDSKGLPVGAVVPLTSTPQGTTSPSNSSSTASSGVASSSQSNQESK